MATIKGYAKSRDIDARAVRRAVANGVIERDPDGQIDELQADAAWASVRRASRMGENQRDDAGTRSAKAKIAIGLARLRMAKQRYEALRERYVSREEAVRVGESEAVYVLDGLKAAPAAYAATLASEMGIPPETALRILSQFIAACLIEIGDLPGAARKDAERA